MHFSTCFPTTCLKLLVNGAVMVCKLWSISTLLVLCVTYPRTVLCVIDKFCRIAESQPDNQGICGVELSSILSLLCQVRGYNKRSLPDSDYLIPHYEEDKDGAFLSKSDASTFLSVKRNKFDSLYGTVSLDGYFQQGIVCECCQHRCTMKELTQYCRHQTTKEKRRSKQQQEPQQQQQPRTDMLTRMKTPLKHNKVKIKETAAINKTTKPIHDGHNKVVSAEDKTSAQKQKAQS